MKKICSLLILFALLFTGCDDKTYHWEFDYSQEQIVEIKIVEFDNYYENEYSIIKEVERQYVPELYSDIQKLEMRRYGTNLSHPSGYCFIITFDNGEYDVISSKEPKRCRYFDGKISGYNSWLCCNKETFENLINKYLSD